MGVTEDVPCDERPLSPQDVLSRVRSCLRCCEDAAIKLTTVLDALSPDRRADTLKALMVSTTHPQSTRDAAGAIISAIKAAADAGFVDSVVRSAKADYFAAASAMRTSITMLDKAIATAIDKANAPAAGTAKAKAKANVEPRQ